MSSHKRGPAALREAPVRDASVEQLEEDPYPFLARLRDEAPVAFVPSLELWLLTCFDDVKRAHSDTAHFTTFGPPNLSACFGDHHILNVDGEQHGRYRRGIDASLSPRSVGERFTGVIEAVVEDQLDLVKEHGSADLLAEYFEPISVLALGHVLGIPEVGADELRTWFRGLMAGGSNISADPEIAEFAAGVSAEIDRRLAPVFECKDRESDGSLISHLLGAAAGNSLRARVADITPTLKLLIAGGLQEPGHAAATTTTGLLSDEAVRRRFAERPAELVRPAVEEAIRWVAPIQQNTRRTKVPVTLHGVTIPAGADVALSVASANRDQRVFGTDSDRFDISRAGRSHIGFGFGSHFCPGNFFGRAVVRTAVTRLFEELPDVRLVEPPRFRGYVFRAPVAVRCRWTPRPRDQRTRATPRLVSDGGGLRSEAERPRV
jgi:cytochrome P450